MNVNVKKFLRITFASLWLFCIFCEAESGHLIVSVKSVDNLYASDSWFFTGVVNYKELYQIVTPTNGVVIDLSVKVGDFVQANSALCKLIKSEPGYARVAISNNFSDNYIINTFVENGQSVESNEVIMQLADRNTYKATFRATAQEVAQIQSTNLLTIELFPGSESAYNVKPTSKLIQAPTNGSPFYLVEVEFRCQPQNCRKMDLVGVPAKIRVTFKNQQYVNLPTKYLLDGMQSIYILDANGLVQKRSVDVISAAEEVASIRNELASDEKIIVEINRIPHPDEKPFQVNFVN